MSPRWRRQLYKVADIVSECQAAQEYWGLREFKNIIIVVYFSYLPKERWELKSGPILQEGSRLLRGKRKSQDLGSTLILKGFCKSLSDLERLPIGVVCSLLKGSTKKKKGEYLILRIDY